MKHIPLITLAALLVPISAHAGDVLVPEPGVLPLLGIGIAVAVAVKFFKKKYNICVRHKDICQEMQK